MSEATSRAPYRVESLDHLVLTVADIEASIAYYTQVLGMEAEVFYPADGSRRHALKFGQQKINLHQAGREYDPKAKSPLPGSADLCFLSGTAVTEWADWLHSLGLKVESGPVHRTGALGLLLSIYLRDPDENLIEISNQIS